MTTAEDAAHPTLAPADAIEATALQAGGARRLASNVSALAASQLVTWFMTLAWTLIVPRALGPSVMGLLVAATSLTAMLGVVLGGIGTRAFLVRALVADPASAPVVTGTTFALRLWLLPVFFGATAVYAHFVDYGTEAVVILYLSTAATVLGLLAEPAQAVFQAVEKMKYLAWSDMLTKTLGSLGAIVLVLLGFGAVGITVFALVVTAGVLVLDLVWARRYVRMDVRADLARVRALTRDSAPYWAFGVIFMVYLWIDSTILALLAPPAAVGWYGVATKLFTTMMFVAVILSTAWLPRLVSAFERGPEHLRGAAREPFELAVILSLPLCVGTALTAVPAIRLLYGAEYHGAAPTLVVLAFCLPLMYANIMLNQVLIAAKRQVVWTWVMAGTTIVNPALNLVLIPVTQDRMDNGAVGAALSLLLTEILIVGVGMLVVGRHVVDTRTLWRLARAVGAAGVMWAVMRVLDPVSWVLAGAVGPCAFVAAALALRVFSDKERAFAVEAIGRATRTCTRTLRRVRAR